MPINSLFSTISFHVAGGRNDTFCVALNDPTNRLVGVQIKVSISKNISLQTFHISLSNITNAWNTNIEGMPHSLFYVTSAWRQTLSYFYSWSVVEMHSSIHTDICIILYIFVFLLCWMFQPPPDVGAEVLDLKRYTSCFPNFSCKFVTKEFDLKFFFGY